MVSSVLQESRVSVAEVEAALQAFTSPKRTFAQNLLILAGTLMLFVLIGVVASGPMGLLVLVVVVLIHELGHLLAMKAFGYRDVQMFFIPLFGAAVSGAETTPSGARRAIVAIAGPAPGIVFGISCLLISGRCAGTVLSEFARAFLSINTLNLLPILPLDGGRFVEAVVFARAPLLRAVFSAAAGIVLQIVSFKTRRELTCRQQAKRSCTAGSKTSGTKDVRI